MNQVKDKLLTYYQLTPRAQKKGLREYKKLYVDSYQVEITAKRLKHDAVINGFKFKQDGSEPTNPYGYPCPQTGWLTIGDEK